MICDNNAMLNCCKVIAHMSCFSCSCNVALKCNWHLFNIVLLFGDFKLHSKKLERVPSHA